MATSKPQKDAPAKGKPAAPAKTTAVATKAAHAVATESDAAMFAADAGKGMEGTSTESFAIPFLAILQKGSPQVDEQSGVAIEGAKSGMFFNTVTQEMFDGKDKGVLVVPVAYRREFIHWGSREGGSGGFKGTKTPEEAAQLVASGKVKEMDGKLFFPMQDGSIHEKKSDRLADTRNHFCLLVDEKTGAAQPILLSLASTQIKKSRTLMSQLSNVKVPGASGPVTPATFANKVRLRTVGESNDKGTWAGLTTALEGFVDKALYSQAKAFHDSIRKGQVQTGNYDDLARSSGAGEDSGGGAAGGDPERF